LIYIILSNKKINENQIFILNLILQNFNNINKNKSIKIFVKKEINNILIDVKNVNFIKYKISNIFEYFKMFSGNTDTRRIIMLGAKNIFFSLFFVFFKKCKYLNINKFDYNILEKDKVSNLIKTILNENPKNILINPKIILDRKVAKNALKIIDWNLTSSGYKKLENLKYIFIYIHSKINNHNDIINDYIKQTDIVLNLKIIIVLNKIKFSDFNKSIEISNRKNIITDYLNNNDKYY